MSQSKPALRLFPNLGAEEGSGWPALLQQPTVAATASLWALLFAPEAQLVPAPGDLSQHWPAALDRARGAAFPWLAIETGLVPWLGSAEAVEAARSESRDYWGPDPDRVARVHDKAFAHEVALREDLVPPVFARSVHVFEADELRDTESALDRIAAALGDWPAPAGGRFTLKPRFGTSGRGRVAGAANGLQAAGVRGALNRLADRGGALLEPWVTRSGDFSTQLRVTEDGSIVLLGSLTQELTTSGLSLGHRGQVDSRGRVFSGQRQDERLREAAARVASAAAAEGYRGPCGVDAFSFLGDARVEELRDVVELNARFTTGTIVIGLVRRALSVLGDRLAVQPGQRASFYFGLDEPAGGWEAAEQRAGPGAISVVLSDSPKALRPGILFARDDSALAAAGVTRSAPSL